MSLSVLIMIIFSVTIFSQDLININTATASQLATLPHIGPSTAKKIVEYREKNGPFQKLEDLMKVPGIGKEIFEAIEPFITISSVSSQTIQTEPYATPTPVDISNILKKFDNEPSILEVQKAVIRYTDLHPDKVAKWWSSVKNQALLPKFNFTIDRDTADDHSYYRKTKSAYSSGQIYILPDEVTKRRDTDDKWELHFSWTWQFSDYIFNRDMLSVADQSQDMVKMRNDLLEEVTKIYFRRRKLQIDMLLHPPTSVEKAVEMQLKIQELTALLDAYTGNYFSEHIKK